MLNIRNLNKKFGTKPVIKQFSYSFQEGVYGLLGPNGAGKTTLIRCITQLYSVSKETIFFEEIPVEKYKNYLSQIGYLPQKFGLFRDLKVHEMLEMLAGLKGIQGKQAKQEVVRCLALVNLSDRIDSKVKTLSGGMIRLLGIAQALLGDPKIILFDEPTAGLDPEERLRFKWVVSEIAKGKTVLLSTHIVSDIEACCDQVLVLSEGELAMSGSCREIQDRAVGKTYILPKEDLKSFNGQYAVQSQFEEGGKIYCRILTAASCNGTPAEPTLEDGYICILKKI